VSLVIYDIAGRQVRTLANEALQAGLTRRSWDGKDGRGNPVSSGVYFVRMQADGRERVHKLTMLW
jgi:flagellar hook assembly protein FlgD